MNCTVERRRAAARERTIVRYLKSHLPTARFRHVQATCAAAQDLARRNGIDPARASLAALLHDAARGMTGGEMIAYVKKHRVPVPDEKEVVARHPSLLHSYVAADMARRHFGVTDRAVLNAVAHHTLGAPRMDTLAKIVYLSDAIAERQYPGIEQLRETALRDLETALRMAMENKIRYVLSAREWLHPLTITTWNALVPVKRPCPRKS